MLGVTFPVTTGVTAEIAMTMKWEREILDPVPGGTVANLSDYRSPLVDPAFFVTESTPTGFKKISGKGLIAFTIGVPLLSVKIGFEGDFGLRTFSVTATREQMLATAVQILLHRGLTDKATFMRIQDEARFSGALDVERQLAANDELASHGKLSPLSIATYALGWLQAAHTATQALHDVKGAVYNEQTVGMESPLTKALAYVDGVAWAFGVQPGTTLFQKTPTEPFFLAGDSDLVIPYFPLGVMGDQYHKRCMPLLGGNGTRLHLTHRTDYLLKANAAGVLAYFQGESCVWRNTGFSNMPGQFLWVGGPAVKESVFSSNAQQQLFKLNPSAQWCFAGKDAAANFYPSAPAGACAEPSKAFSFTSYFQVASVFDTALHGLYSGTIDLVTKLIFGGVDTSLPDAELPWNGVCSQLRATSVLFFPRV